MVVSFVNGLLTKLQKAPCRDMKRKRRVAKAKIKVDMAIPLISLSATARGIATVSTPIISPSFHSKLFFNPYPSAPAKGHHGT